MNQRQVWVGGGVLATVLVGLAIYLVYFQKGQEIERPGPVTGPDSVTDSGPEIEPEPLTEDGSSDSFASMPSVFEPAPVSLAAATEHYYRGSDARQVGVQENAIVAQRAAVLKGRVLGHDGQPLAGVMVDVAHHPELGSTLSQADGAFQLVVNGGGHLCIHYKKVGFLPLCRFVNAPWQDHAWLPDVVLITVDPQVTSIDLNSPAPIQVARGSVVKDEDGERQATVFIPKGTSAQMILPDKSLKALDSIKVRITEYTVGPNGPAAMPAALPPSSAYTYAFELSADEVIAEGIKVAGKDLILSQPVLVFVENFLKFPVGTLMPLGYFDNDKGAWIAAENGLAIGLLPPTGDLAEIDIDGTGVVADAAALEKLGVSEDERKQLAALYKPGQSLWRVKVSHFSSHDINEAPGTPPDAQATNASGGKGGYYDDCGNWIPYASLISVQNQILGEDIGLVGVPFGLHYRSNLAAGHAASRSLRIPLSGNSTPESLKRIDLEIYVAGQKHVKSFPPDANQSHTFVWDGKDSEGRILSGAQPATIRIGWVFDADYQVPPRFGDPPVRPTPVRSREELAYWRDEVMTIGSLDGRGLGMGGFSLSIQHRYDPIGRILYLGHGGIQGANSGGKQVFNQAIDTVAGGGSNFALGNGGPAVEARLNDIRPNPGRGTPRDRYVRYPNGLVVAPDGSIYVSDANDQVRKVTPDGIIQTIAGGGTKTPEEGLNSLDVEFAHRATGGLALGADGSVYLVAITEQRVWRIGLDGKLSLVAGSGRFGFDGDGGLATEASLAHPAAIAVAVDGSVYISDTENNRIRRVAPDGIINTVAGNGTKGFSGDGGPAHDAEFYSPTGLALAPDGTLYITDAGNYVIRRLTPGGGLSTVAGMHREDWTHGFGGDGGPPLEAKFDEPSGIALGPDGALYITDTDNHRIRRVGLDGVVATIAGSKVEDSDVGDYGGDGGPASEARLAFPNSLAFGPDGSLYVYDGFFRTEITNIHHRIRRIGPALPGFTNKEIVIPSENGQELYKFSATGQHLETLNSITLNSIYRFGYDSGGRLIKVRDAYNNETIIERDPSGHPGAIVAPFGQRTELTLDAGGYLAKVTNPAGEFVELTYHPGGLLAGFRNPRGDMTKFDYDEMGRLIKDEDPDGGFIALARTESERGYEVALTTALKPATLYSVDSLADGSQNRLEKCCCGAETATAFAMARGHELRHPDGTVDTVTLQPDPRWGLHSPILKNMTVTTPGGLKSETTFQRNVSLVEPNNPMSLQSVVDTHTVNGRTFTNTLDVAAKTIVGLSPSGRTRKTTFDDLDRIISIEDPGILPVLFDYDDKSRVVAIRQGEGDEQRLMRFDYDSYGNVAMITDPLKRTVRLEYDLAGRLVKQTLPDNREIAYVYDAQGNLVSLIPPGKTAHTFEYTAVNLTAGYSPPEVSAGLRDTEYEYNKDRKLTKVSRPDGKSIDIVYDTFGLVESVTIPGQEMRFKFDAPTEQLRSIAGADGSLSFSYDGHLPTETTWDGPITGRVSRTFDNDFRLSSISVNDDPATEFKYDADGSLIQSGELKMERDPATGFLKGTQLGNISTTYEYSNFGERKKFVASVSGKDLIAIDYERDAVGRILKKTETIEGVTDVYTYEYDLAGRLKTATKNGDLVGQYEYDSNGNRTKYEGQLGTRAGSYDAQDRIESYGPATFKHNANGDLESKTEEGKTTAFEYDSFGNQRTATLSNGARIEYISDATNRRIGEKVDGHLSQGLLYQNQLRPIAELDGLGKIASRFVYGANDNVPEYFSKEGKTYRIITDHLGSPRLVMDSADGNIVQRMEYDEFGNVVHDSNPGFQPFGFAGGLFESQTQLLRFGVRDYDPVTGRWSAKDPIGFSGGQANLFSYVANDPINRRDPHGLQDNYPIRFGAPTAAQTSGGSPSFRYNASCWLSNAGGNGVAGGRASSDWPIPDDLFDQNRRVGPYAEGDIGFEDQSFRGRVGVEYTVPREDRGTTYRAWAETNSSGGGSVGVEFSERLDFEYRVGPEWSVGVQVDNQGNVSPTGKATFRF